MVTSPGIPNFLRDPGRDFTDLPNLLHLNTIQLHEHSANNRGHVYKQDLFFCFFLLPVLQGWDGIGVTATIHRQPQAKRSLCRLEGLTSRWWAPKVAGSYKPEGLILPTLSTRRKGGEMALQR